MLQSFNKGLSNNVDNMGEAADANVSRRKVATKMSLPKTILKPVKGNAMLC
jgi:hypothetical protein